MSIAQEHVNSMTLSTLHLSHLQRLEACSPFMMRLLLKDKALLEDLLQNGDISYRLEDMQIFLASHEINSEDTLKKVLRQLRQRVLARIIYRDVNSLADFNEVVKMISDFADFAIKATVDYLNTLLVAQYGQPRDDRNNPQSFVVIGMGKLGGAELNVSSDIDLIFAYEQDGKTDGEASISNQDFFVKLGKKFIAVLDDVTEDGFVFRVDMRLRPFGNEGVLATSLDALEEYYQNNGREWERYAWIKGREITGGTAVSKLLKPFVYRKYLDYGALASMRDLKAQIQREVNVRSAKTSGGKDNIKLGRGGIREIEFIAQVFQLIRGGQDPSLQIRPTLQVLQLLSAKHLLPKEAVSALSEAYVFLRNVEHRLMYVEDAQTQDLPKHAEAQSRIAIAMNFASWDDFMLVLNQHRNTVRMHFDQTFSIEKSKHETHATHTNVANEEQLAIAKSIWNGEFDDAVGIAALEKLGYQKAQDTLTQIRNLRQGHRYRQLPELSQQRFSQLIPPLIAVASQVDNPDIALMRTLDLIDAICRRASYLAMLTEFPDALNLVVRLCGASAWFAQYLIKHPIVLDELLDKTTLYSAPNFDEMHAELTRTMAALDGDVEQQMDAMRRFQHAIVFRFAAQDIAGQLSLETLSDYLSALADLVLDVSITTIWRSFNRKHIETPKFAIIGYGKLGSKELGYASDLDIIFLFDDAAEDAGGIYARFAQRINNWFNSLTSAGVLYEIDLQLRPDGNSGLLVSSVQAFRDYQLKRAWTWEHQAMTRARFVAGDAHVGKAFAAIRKEVIQQVRDKDTLRTVVVEMREKMRQAQHLNEDTFDLKQSPGGIVDVEFIVQYLVLANAAQYPELTQNLGNIALLANLGTLGIIDTTLAQQSADAYREYRLLQHAARLQGDMQAKVEKAQVEAHANAVISLWKQVFLT